MEKILLIIAIILLAVCAAMAAVNMALIIKKKRKDNQSDSQDVIAEIDALNNNLNDIKNMINEHTSGERRILSESFGASNRSFTDLLKEYLNSFKDTVDSNLKASKEQLSEIREEMRGATKQMRGDTVVALDKMKEEINNSLKDMRSDNRVHLDDVKQNNEKQLKLMRETVDEKLSNTLNDRIKHAFEIVNDSLGKVQQGFGEMKDLSTKVTNLNKMFANVKTRGGWGEVALESLLDQILSPEQYATQFRLSKTSQEAVDFVIVMPGQGEDTLYLPIDSKFPLDRYAALIEASEQGDQETTERARKALVDEVKREARSIQSKYIKVPKTTNFAIMYLPTEGLYAEIAKDSALMNQLQTEFRVTVCGPTTITALLNSLQTGFTTLRIQKRSGEILKELQQFQKDFKKYTDLIGKVKKNAETVVTQIGQVEQRNDIINRRLAKVGGELPDVDDNVELIASDLSEAED